MRLSLVQCNRLVVGRLLVTSMAAIVLLVAFLLTIPTEAFGVTHTLKRSSSHQATTVLHTSTTDQDASSLSSSIEDCEDPCTALSQHMIQILPRYVADAQTYATSMDLPLACQSIFQFFTALKSQQQDVLGMTGRPFCIRNHQWPSHCDGFFTIADLEQAVMDDFLDAARGSTDNRKGWTVRYEIEIDTEKSTYTDSTHRTLLFFAFLSLFRLPMFHNLVVNPLKKLA